MERRLNEFGGEVESFSESREIETYLQNCGVIVDAIFGIGLNSPLRDDALRAVRMINASRAVVVSVDIPSGVGADTGEILGDAVMADITVTFTAAKPGHFIEPGCTRRGALRVCDIGIPKELARDAHSEIFAVTRDDVSLPPREKLSHKGNYGRDLIVGGSARYTGAPALAARAASRAGAGLVFVGVPEAIAGIVAVKCHEEMPVALPAESGFISPDAAGAVLEEAAKCDAVLVGPGFGKPENARVIVSEVIKRASCPIILDADGINGLAGNIDILDEAAGPVILTPHEGEFQRLTGQRLSGDRLSAAVGFAKAHGVILVLKGHRTITALPDGTAYVNTTGGPAMAKAGSGDVLAGIILALVGQGFPIRDAVITAVYIHGAAGDLCAKRLGEYSVTAGDMIKTIPEIMKELAI